MTLVLHDYVTQRGGAERVALLLAERLGGGELTTSVYVPEETHVGFSAIKVHELLGRSPTAVKRSRTALAPLAAAAFLKHKQVADVVLCSSSGWSHWTSSQSPSVVYCYTPPRWAWAPEDYFRGMPSIVRALTPTVSRGLAVVDRRQAAARNRYIAISSTTRERIRHAYGVDADIVPPPVTLTVEGDEESVEDLQPGFVLTISRARGYKNAGLAQASFRNGSSGQLVIVGGEVARKDGHILQLGRVSDAQLRWLYRHCRAVLALSHEDFGLTPVEGHLFGKPTIALRAGGYLDTCREDENAVWVKRLDIAEVQDAVARADRARWNADEIRQSARLFSVEAFISRMSDVLDEVRSSA